MGKDRRGEEWQQRERDVWRLRVQGQTQTEIAAQVGITQAAVSQILTRLSRRFTREFVEEARQVKLQQTAVLEQVISEALVQWRRSCEDAVTISHVTGRVRITKDADGCEVATPLPDQVTRTVTGQSGNPGLLAQARGALADIRTVWGLDAPQRQEVTGPGGGPIPTISEIIVELPRPPEETPALAAATDTEQAEAAALPANNGRPLEVVVELPE